MSVHWATQYIGMNWKMDGDSVSEGMNCFVFLVHVQNEHYGLNLTDIKLNIDLDQYSHKQVVDELSNQSKMSQWVEVNKPTDGDIVVMRAARYPSHIGTWVEAGSQRGVLHVTNNAGCIFSSPHSLSSSGWRVVAYYRHRSRVSE